MEKSCHKGRYWWVPWLAVECGRSDVSEKSLLFALDCAIIWCLIIKQMSKSKLASVLFLLSKSFNNNDRARVFGSSLSKTSALYVYHRYLAPNPQQKRLKRSNRFMIGSCSLTHGSTVSLHQLLLFLLKNKNDTPFFNSDLRAISTGRCHHPIVLAFAHNTLCVEM